LCEHLISFKRLMIAVAVYLIDIFCKTDPNWLYITLIIWWPPPSWDYRESVARYLHVFEKIPKCIPKNLDLPPHPSIRYILTHGVRFQLCCPNFFDPEFLLYPNLGIVRPSVRNAWASICLWPSRGDCVEWVYSSFTEIFTVFFNGNFLLVFLKKNIGEE
jgi:hypothetical protein